MVHWQIAADRSRFFIYMLLAMLIVFLIGSETFDFCRLL